jgi:hypothetical protein
MMGAAGFGVGDAVGAIARVGNPLNTVRTEHARYRYRVAQDEWLEASIRYVRGTGSDWLREGASVTVLYDPTKPKRHSIYRLLGAVIEVLPAAAPAPSS